MRADLSPPDLMPLVLRPHPFSADTGVVVVQPGQTVAAMLREAAGGHDLAPLEVRVGGYVVPAELWDRVKPKPGSVLTVTGLPQGNMNENWRAVLMIAVAVVAWWAAPQLALAYGGTSGMWASGIMMVGNLAINALVKPPTPGGLTASEQKSWHQLTGSSNQINPGGPIPIVLGGSRYFPPHAAIPYSSNIGDQNTQYCLFDLGFNVEADDVSELKIGDTPISAFSDVAWEVATNPTLYKNDVSELFVGVTLEDDDEVIRTTAPNTESISVDFVFPAGLYGTDEENEHMLIVFWDIQYRPSGTTTWLEAPSPRFSGMRYRDPMNGDEAPFAGMYAKAARWYDPFATGIEWDVPTGQYDVRVIRRPTRYMGNVHYDVMQYNVMRSIRFVPPSTTGTTKLAMRIKANDQLTGTLQTLSCLVEPKFPVYDEGAGTWSRQRTLNAGWLYHWLLTECPATIRKVAPSRMHLDQILEFVDFCDRHDFETRMVVDSASTVGQVVDLLLRSSAGERTMTDGRYGVTFVPDTEPLAEDNFAPTEVKDFALVRTFARIPHALKVKFRNPLADWESDEVVVPDDGYSWRGLDARGAASALPEATLFETLDLQSTMLPQHAWRLARMHFAQAKFSPASYTWSTDIAGLKLTKGSAVTVAHDVPEWGTGAGRVVSLGGPGPVGAATLVLDAEIETDPTKTYRMQIRGPSGTQAINATPHSPRTATFYLATMPTGVQAGDVGILGETNVSKPTLLVTHMRGSAQLDFGVQAVAWDERAAPYWADPPEDIISEVTGRGFLEAPDPPQVTVNGDGEDADDAGIVSPVIRVGVRQQPRHLPVYDTALL